MKVYFINDSTSNPNWGDRAAAISLKKMIVESGGNIIDVISEEELGISSFSNKMPINNEDQNIQQSSIKENLKLFIPPIFLKIRQKYFERSTSFASDDIIPQRWEDFDRNFRKLISNKHQYSNLLNSIEQSDIVVIYGNGCMTGNGRIPRAELFITYIAKKHFRKPVIILNHTADFDHSELLKMALNVYPLYDDVVFRDSISVKRCKAFCNGRLACFAIGLKMP